MKIDIENLGGIDKGSIELNDFTIFCGKNNSGKTYAMYSIYGLFNKRINCNFDFVKPIVDKLKKEGVYCLDIADFIAKKDEIIERVQEEFKCYLHLFFGVNINEFSNTNIRLCFNKELEKIQDTVSFSYHGLKAGYKSELSLEGNNGKIQLFLSSPDITDISLQFFISERLADIILFNWSPYKNIFLLPAERDGINIFFKELFSIRNLLLQQTQNVNVKPMLFLKDIIEARYAEPIKDYLQYLSMIGSIKEETSDYKKYAQVIEKNVLGGKYQVDDSGNVDFMPSESNNTLPLHFSSSTVKTLFGLVFYLKHLAKEGDYLMIDEPELNLHPDNQRQVARVLAQLVNAGLKVIVSTHSDYFIRELNNLIMLKNGFSGAKELQKKYGYQDNELLAGKQVSAYLFDDKKITTMALGEEGIVAETFNDVINKLNQSSNEIYYAMQDAKELENWALLKKDSLNKI